MDFAKARNGSNSELLQIEMRLMKRKGRADLFSAGKIHHAMVNFPCGVPLRVTPHLLLMTIS
jgi:hypothetical protein